MQHGEIQAHRRVSETTESVTISLEEELRKGRYRVKVIQQEVRSERDAVDRHETESRLLTIEVRNVDGGSQYCTGSG